MKQRFFDFYRNYKLHIVVWFIFVMYESVITSLVFSNWVNPIIYLSHYAVFILFFYIHSDYALPWSLKFKRVAYILVPLIVLSQGFAHIVCQYLVSYLLKFLEFTKKDIIINLNSILLNVYRSFTYLLLATGYYFLKTYSLERKKNEELEKEKLRAIISKQQIEQQLDQAKHAFLKAQINPHFLFNTLDFLFHQVNLYSESAGEAIVRLADMMRFAINTDQIANHIKLSHEIEQVENLIYLQALTRNGQQTIQFDHHPAVQHIQFIPLVLLTLTENMLKHGDVSRQENNARISLQIADEQLIIKTSNLIGRQTNPKSSKSGLINITRRLSYAYGDAAHCSYVQNDDQFQTEIKVQLNALKSPA